MTQKPGTSAVLARIDGMDVRKLAASTQYGMGLVIVIEGAKHLMNGIVYRNDSMSHDERVKIADGANQILRQNAHVDAQIPAPTKPESITD